MNRISLAAAAILVATGSAFAGSDHYGSTNANQLAAPVAGVDHAVTGAVKNTDMAEHKAPVPGRRSPPIGRNPARASGATDVSGAAGSTRRACSTPDF